MTRLGPVVASVQNPHRLPDAPLHLRVGTSALGTYSQHTATNSYRERAGPWISRCFCRPVVPKQWGWGAHECAPEWVERASFEPDYTDPTLDL